MMHQSKIEERLPEPQLNNEIKADVTSVRPSIAKPHVSGSNLSKGMVVFDEEGKEWTVLSCDDLHNVHLIKEGDGLLINVNGKDIECGGSDLCCLVENCNEFIEHRPTYCH